jgi:predicted MFS family arabinose efflux permease
VATVVTDDTRLSPTDRSVSRYRWYVLGTLVTIGALSWIDRQLLGMVMQSVKNEFSLTDTQLGLLGGTAFGLFYVTVGLPVAWVADRFSRRNLIAAALGFWSLMTALCGFATGYTSLLAARVGVGLGEAGQAAPSQSMVSDYFPPHQRAFAMGVLYSFVPIGYLISYSAGGFFNDTIGWRAAFVLFGVVGIAVAILFRFTVREPSRGMSDPFPAARPALPAPPMGATLLKFLSRPSMRHIAIGGAAHGIGMFAAALWLPSFFIRTHHMSSTDVGLRLALLMGVGGLLGTLGGGLIADRVVAKTGDKRWAAWLCALVLTCVIPFTIIVYTVSSPAMAFVFFAVPAVLNHMILGPIVATMQNLGGVRRRAMAAAFYLLLVNLVAMGLGPLLVGTISDRLHDALGNDALRYSLLWVSTITTAWAAMHLFLAGRTLARDIAAADED